jgi:hypothetical protein
MYRANVLGIVGVTVIKEGETVTSDWTVERVPDPPATSTSRRLVVGIRVNPVSDENVVESSLKYDVRLDDEFEDTKMVFDTFVGIENV